MLCGVHADELEHAECLLTTGRLQRHTYSGSDALAVEHASELSPSAGAGEVVHMTSAQSHTPLDLRSAAHAPLLAA